MYIGWECVLKAMILMKMIKRYRLGKRSTQVRQILDWAASGLAILVVIATLGVASVGCRSLESNPPTITDQVEDFAIYLLPAEYFFEGISIEKCTALGSKLLGQGDILTYSWFQHDILMDPSAAERIAGLDLTGNPFVTCVGDTEIYRGEIMAAFMSRSSNEVVILWPPMDGDTTHFSIQLGYPGADFFVGSDPRVDERIKAALITAGVLRD